MNKLSREDMAIEPERYELYEEPSFVFDLDRREFLRVLGAGLVVVCLVRDANASQESGGAQRRRGGNGAAPREIGAWLHIALDGSISAYTGKAEVGQNIRTSLAQAVADELDVPLGSVRMVMADTAQTPFDMGTFGSRTTPSMAPQLRKAAAAAREHLLAQAAEAWKVDRQTLKINDGTIEHQATHRSIGLGELTKGQKLLATIGDDVHPTPADQWKVSGHSAAKVDGASFVTGKHKYSTDVKRPGMLHGRVLRPPSFNAALVSADVSAATAIPGVTVTRDGDLLGVCAADESTAARALAAIRAEWKPASDPCSDKNLFKDLRGRGPGVDAGKAAGVGGEHSVEASYTAAYIAHTPLEPRSAVAEWEGDALTVWTGTQRPFGVRDELARAFGLAAEKVRVIVPDTGSGYGGKHTGEAAIEAARLAKAARKPVKRVWTREEEFTWAYFRPAAVIEAHVSANRDGKITSWHFHNFNSGGSGLETPYRVVDKHSAFHNTKSPLRQGSYRALASSANHFARESLMDELARGVGIDPLAFRLANLDNNRLRAVLHAAAERFGWGKTKPATDHGFGIAGGTEKGGFVATCAEVAVDRESGKVQVVRLVAAFECGAIVNHDHLINQVEGSLMMGLGGALFEAIKFDQGKILNARLSRYRVPRFSDVPAIDVVLIDRKDLPSSGAGECPIIAVAPAIANAICDATGKRLRAMPLAPDGLKG